MDEPACNPSLASSRSMKTLGSANARSRRSTAFTQQLASLRRNCSHGTIKVCSRNTPRLQLAIKLAAFNVALYIMASSQLSSGVSSPARCSRSTLQMPDMNSHLCSEDKLSTFCVVLDCSTVELFVDYSTLFFMIITSRYQQSMDD